MLPDNPEILLSVINTKLRDEFPDFRTLCEELDADSEEIIEKLASIGCKYDEAHNCFH